MWRTLGRFLDTGAGARLTAWSRPLVNWSTKLLPAPRVDSEPPWRPLAKPLPECRVAVVNTAGLHLEDQEPFDVDAPKGDPSFRILPSGIDPATLKIAHAHYPHRYVERDPEVILPAGCLRELERAGVLRLAPRWPSFGFGGLLTREYIDPRRGTAWQVARILREDEVDLAIFVPA